NATYAVRGQLQEGLRTVEHLGAWLRDMRPRLENPLPDKELLALTEADAAAARELRDAIRSLAQSIVDGSAADATALRVLNRTARAAHLWRELRWDGAPAAVPRADGR